MAKFRPKMRGTVYAVLAAFGAFVALAVSPPGAAAASAQNSEIRQLKQQLKKNQELQQKLQQQYQDMAQKVDELSQKLNTVKGQVKTVAVQAKKSKPSDWVLKGTTIETRDKTTQIHFGAYMQLDGALAANAAQALNGQDSAAGVQFRRLRLYSKGILYGLFPFKFEYDFADTKSGDSAAKGIKDAYLGYTGLTFHCYGEPVKTEFLAGNQYVPFFGHVPSKWREFMEADLAYYTFEPPREVGASFRAWQRHWNFWTGATVGQGPGNNTPPNLAQDWEYGAFTASGGLAIVPVNDQKNCRFLSIAGSVAYHSTSKTGGETHWDRWNNTPDSHVFDTKLIDTGALLGNDARTYGGVVMGEYGPFDILARYYYVNVVGATAHHAGNVHFDGWAAQMGYFLTPGDHRGFSTHSASFSGVHPVDPVIFNRASGCWWGFSGLGAWQIALQGDQVDLRNGVINGGKETDISAALDWYLNYNVRVMWQITDVLSVDGGKYAGIAPLIYGMRLQYFF